MAAGAAARPAVLTDKAQKTTEQGHMVAYSGYCMGSQARKPSGCRGASLRQFRVAGAGLPTGASERGRCVEVPRAGAYLKPMEHRAQPYDVLLDRLPGLGRDPGSVRRRVEAMERILERMVVVPGLNRPVGLDVMLDLLPIAGDLVGAALGLWLVWEARNLGMSRWTTLRMVGNVAVDTLLGAIPWVGAIPDFFFRSNTRNLRIIRRHLDRHHPASATLDQ